MMYTLKSNVNDRPRMQSAVLPDGILRVADGILCRCGRPVKNYPKSLGSPHSLALICDGCHQDVFSYEPQS